MGKVNLFPIQHQTSFTITNLGLSTAGQNQMVERTYQTLFFPFFRHVLTSLRLAPRSPRGSSEKAPLCLPEQYVRITFASGSHANGQTVYSGASLCVCVCVCVCVRCGLPVARPDPGPLHSQRLAVWGWELLRTSLPLLLGSNPCLVS